MYLLGPTLYRVLAEVSGSRDAHAMLKPEVPMSLFVLIFQSHNS